MSYVNFFQSQLSDSWKIKGPLFDHKGNVCILIQGKGKPSARVYLKSLDSLGIRQKILKNLSGIQGTGSTEDIKEQLDNLKSKLIKQINSDRGFFNKLSKTETRHFDTYFAEMNVLLDTPATSKISKFLAGTFTIGILGALAFGAHWYFGQ